MQLHIDSHVLVALGKEDGKKGGVGRPPPPAPVKGGGGGGGGDGGAGEGVIRELKTKVIRAASENRKDAASLAL